MALCGPRIENGPAGADHRAGEVLVSLLGQAGKADVDDPLARGEFMRAGRRARELTSLRLIDAKSGQFAAALSWPSAVIVA